MNLKEIDESLESLERMLLKIALSALIITGISGGIVAFVENDYVKAVAALLIFASIPVGGVCVFILSIYALRKWRKNTRI